MTSTFMPSLYCSLKTPKPERTVFKSTVRSKTNHLKVSLLRISPCRVINLIKRTELRGEESEVRSGDILDSPLLCKLRPLVVARGGTWLSQRRPSPWIRHTLALKPNKDFCSLLSFFLLKKFMTWFRGNSRLNWAESQTEQKKTLQRGICCSQGQIHKSVQTYTC